MTLRAHHAPITAGALLLLLTATSAHAVIPASTTISPPANFDDEGLAKLVVNKTGGGTVGCSGSLLAGGQYVLTAAHCVANSTSSVFASSINFTFANGVTASALGSNVRVNSGYLGSSSSGLINGVDLALVKLNAPVNIAGYALATTYAAPGTDVLLTGYGQSGTGATGATTSWGSLRFGYNEYDNALWTTTTSGRAAKTYLYDFDNGKTAQSAMASLGLGNLEAEIAPGDSGGGSFVYDPLSGRWLLSGVHSFMAYFSGKDIDSKASNGSFGEGGGDTAVYSFANWIRGLSGTSASIAGTGVASPVSNVPEPETWAMLLIGLVPIAAAIRQQQRG